MKWRYTSHEVYLRLRLTKVERLEHYCTLFDAPINDVELRGIRSATNAGLALGKERFKDEIEALSGRRLRAKRRGLTEKLLYKK